MLIGKRILHSMVRSTLLFLAMSIAAAPPSNAAVAEPGVFEQRPHGSAVSAMPPRPRPDAWKPVRCTADGSSCISAENYFPDVCRTVEAAAVGSDLDPSFLARLIWQESRFDARAVSPAGAEGIAQFMPGTAELRDLADAFNPAESLWAAAEYLSDLRREYGNLGLAAAAYNAGEGRLEQYLSGTAGLPAETWHYVVTITGYSAAVWRDSPPADVNLSLKMDDSFQDACVARAGGQTFAGFREPLSPWGVIVTSNISEAGAARHVERLRNRYSSVLEGERVDYTFDRTLGMRRSMHIAQIGRETRPEAERLCARLRESGGVCVVLRN